MGDRFGRQRGVYVCGGNIRARWVRAAVLGFVPTRYVMNWEIKQ